MSLPEVRSNDQKLADAVEFHQVQMWRAARTVQARVPEPIARHELLDCLGLLDVTAPRGS